MVDSRFVLVIRDVDTGAILFVGRVLKPASEEVRDLLERADQHRD
jgi:serine protease inhibitor